jgi:hypothetical protein
VGSRSKGRTMQRRKNITYDERQAREIAWKIVKENPQTKFTLEEIVEKMLGTRPIVEELCRSVSDKFPAEVCLGPLGLSLRTA